MVTETKRSIALSQEFVSGSGEIVAELTPAEVPSIALEVTMLLCELASVLTLRSPKGEKIEIRLGAPGARAAVSKPVAAHWRFDLTQDQAEYLQVFLLRTVRDEMAAVNHIHLEGLAGKDDFDLTFMFQVYAPPMSPEEAAKLMGRPYY